MDAPVSDPPVPYIGPISGARLSLNPGKSIRIVGTTPSTAERFDINLQCGAETAPASDVALHISVRLVDNCISLNSSQNGTWGEERQGTTSPIKRAEKFEIIMECNFGQYKVTINGQLYDKFPQRVRYDRITHLAIDGDVFINQISCESTVTGGTQAASTSVSVMQTDRLERTDMLATNIPSPGIHASASSGIFRPSYKTALDRSSKSSYSTRIPHPTNAAGGTDVQVFFDSASTKFQPRLQPVSDSNGSKVGVRCAFIATAVIIVATVVVKTAIQ